jgi:NhaP-type Na+/H+ or K+/H+ antiporter
LRGWQIGYFAFHALFGILLGSLVGTALARLMQTE